MQLLGETAAKISNFASYLRSVFRTDTDPTTLEVAAATLGHLVQTGGALTADVVEYEVGSPLHVLQSKLCKAAQHSIQSVCSCHKGLDTHGVVYTESVGVMECEVCRALLESQSGMGTAAQHSIQVPVGLVQYAVQASNDIMLSPCCCTSSYGAVAAYVTAQQCMDNIAWQAMLSTAAQHSIHSGVVDIVEYETCSHFNQYCAQLQITSYSLLMFQTALFTFINELSCTAYHAFQSVAQ